MDNLVLIETYRGWDIHFNKAQGVFTSINSDLDEQKDAGSFYAAKKSIDDYVKRNDGFKPFKIERIPDASSDYQRQIIHVVGIRKDGRFVVIETVSRHAAKPGDRVQLSEYDERKYCVVAPENEPHNSALFAILADYERQIDELRANAKATRAQFIKGGTLADKKRELGY